MNGTAITTHPIHLGLGASATAEPLFTGMMDWYADYVARHADDGREGRLVSLHTFQEPWAMWEMHPHGAEVVLCIDGEIVLYQETANGTQVTITLRAGEYAVNGPGTWHTADVQRHARALFITAGMGTEHRPR